ncbi:MAG: iron export ABC transporter permease subunit FetB [Actinomycetota bacterium]|nr:iron export ABC transporter permease subunit FetB [Actinomycetota bacterium]
MTTDVSFVGLALASSLVAVAIALSMRQHLGLERQILWASIRALVQLLTVGLVLTVLLRPGQSLLWSVVWVIAMLPFAANVVARRAPEVPRVRWLALAAFSITSVVVPGLLFGLGVFPLEPRTLVPLAGMMIGNSMTATVLVATRIVAEFKEKRPLVEVRLALGFRSQEAFRPYLRSALKTALVPQIETTKAVGIVFLPGAMTGLILAGVDPMGAVRVQIVVMYLVLGSVAVSTSTVALGLSRTLFTSDQRAVHLPDER